MNGKMKAALKRMLVLIFSVVLLLGSVSYYAPSHVQAEDWSGGQGTSNATYINLEGGNGQGHADVTFCQSVDCVMISFWENTAGGKKECVGCVIQPFNTTSSYYSNIEYALGVGGMRKLRGTSFIEQSLRSIIKTECSVPAGIPIYIVGQNAFGYTSINSNQKFSTATAPGTDGSYFPSQAAFPFGVDASAKYMRSTATERFTQITEPQFSDQSRMQTALASFNNAVNGQYVLGVNVSVGVSEIALKIRNTDMVLGCCFPSNYNVMGVQESGLGDIFIANTQACFTYLGSTTTTTSSICTYDVVGTPDHPDYSEKPNGNPDKSGEYVINKVYIDLTGTDDADFTTPSVCPAIVIDDERGKIDSAWSFVGWKPSAIGASGYSKSNYTGFNSGLHNTTGMIDARSELNGMKQLNLLFVKQTYTGASKVEITEQSLGVGCTTIYPFAALEGKDEAGWYKQSDGTCSYVTSITYCDDDHDGNPDSDCSGHKHYCGAAVSNLIAKKAERSVSYNSALFFATFSTVSANSAYGSNTGVNLPAGTGLTGNNNSTATSWAYDIKWTNDKKHSHTATATNHNPSGSATVLLEDAVLNVTNFAVYRNLGLNDGIVPLFNKSIYATTWTNNAQKTDQINQWIHWNVGATSLYSGAYANALSSSNSRQKGGGAWSVLASRGTTGSQLFSVSIPKGVGTGKPFTTTFTNNSADTPSNLSEATLNTTRNDLLNAITVHSYLATPSITPANYGDRTEYDVKVTPIVVMRLPYAQDSTGKAVDSTAAANIDKAGYVLVRGEYQRELLLRSAIDTRIVTLDGLEITPNTVLNDARVNEYLIDDLDWSSTTAPYPIPGGSTIFVGQSTDASRHEVEGTPGRFEMVINTPFIGHSPFRAQLDNQFDKFFDPNGVYLNGGGAMVNMQMQDAKDWVKHYLGETSDTHYAGGECIDKYISRCVDEMTKTYIALYVTDGVDRDSFVLEDCHLFKASNSDTPTGFISGGKITLDGQSRTVHTDTKYSFGGIDNHVHMRVAREMFPETQFSYIGIDTCGGAYAISGWNFDYSMPFEDPSEWADPTRYRQYMGELWAALGYPATFSEFKAAINSLDRSDTSDASTLRKLYEAACAISLSEIGGKYTRQAIYDAYIYQYPLGDMVCSDANPHGRAISVAGYWKDNRLTTNIHHVNVDGTLYDRLYQLSDSVEHDVGNDTTWYKDGDWYNEAILPYYVVNTREKITLYYPSNSSTVIDTSLMGLSLNGKDDVLKADETAWNGAMVSFAFDGMTASEFDKGVLMTLPKWGDADVTVELSQFGVSHPLAISNTDVSDLY